MSSKIWPADCMDIFPMQSAFFLPSGFIRSDSPFPPLSDFGKKCNICNIGTKNAAERPQTLGFCLVTLSVALFLIGVKV